MSVALIGPGPLEGGPMVSPGPAKGGEEFSAHFKQACEPPQGNRDSGKPVTDSRESSPLASKGTPPSPKESAPLPPKKSTDGPSPAPSKNAPPSEPIQTVVETTAPASEEPPVSPTTPDPLISVSAPVLNLLVPEIPVDGSPKENGDPINSKAVPPVQISTTVVDSQGLVEDPLPETVEGRPAPVGKKPGKDNEKTAEITVPVQINLLAMIPLPSEPVPKSSVVVSAAPADEGSISPVGSVLTAPAPATSVLTAPAPTASTVVTPAPVESAVTEPLPQPTLSTDPVAAPKPERSAAGQPKPLKDKNVPEKAPETVPPDGLVTNKPVTDPSPKSLVQGVPKPTTPSHEDPSPRRAEVDARKDPPPVRVEARPVPILPAVIVPRDMGPWEELPKSKASPSDAVESVTASRPAIPSGTESVSLPPSIDGAPAVSAPQAAPAVLTPAPVDLARQIHVHLESGRSVVHIDLHPEHLGELRISLEAKGKDVAMQFTVDNDNARQSVVAGLREITGTLSTLGWSVTGLTVHVSSGGVGNGRGETGGPLWTAPSGSNVVASEPEPSAAPAAAGQWRVNLVA